jgi:hypothetical protein
MTRHPLAAPFVSVLVLVATALGGCASDAQTGALAGAGIGALAGQAIGGSTKGTLIGVGVGAAAGYVIGNESDKKKARSYSGGVVPSSELAPFSGTSWNVAEIETKKPQDWLSMTVSFEPDGTVVTRRTLRSGDVVIATERYRVVQDTLIINRSGYIINAAYRIDGDRLTLRSEEWDAVLERAR